jgi:hypothetical protein
METCRVKLLEIFFSLSDFFALAQTNENHTTATGTRNTKKWVRFQQADEASQSLRCTGSRSPPMTIEPND